MVEFAKATKKELYALEEFLKCDEIDSSFTPPLSCRSISIQNRVYRERYVWLLAKEEGAIVGCRAVLAKPSEDMFTFSTFVVEPNYRRCGIGERLFCESLIFAAGLGHRFLFFDAPDNSDAVKSLAEKYGFDLVELKNDDKRPAGIRTATFSKKLL